MSNLLDAVDTSVIFTNIYNNKMNIFGMSNLERCCDGMNRMIEDGVMGISNKNNRIWLKILKHNGTADLEPYKGFVDYNEITNCPFCGRTIQVR